MSDFRFTFGSEISQGMHEARAQALRERAQSSVENFQKEQLRSQAASLAEQIRAAKVNEKQNRDAFLANREYQKAMLAFEQQNFGLNQARTDFEIKVDPKTGMTGATTARLAGEVALDEARQFDAPDNIDKLMGLPSDYRYSSQGAFESAYENYKNNEAANKRLAISQSNQNRYNMYDQTQTLLTEGMTSGLRGEDLQQFVSDGLRTMGFTDKMQQGSIPYRETMLGVMNRRFVGDHDPQRVGNANFNLLNRGSAVRRVGPQGIIASKTMVENALGDMQDQVRMYGGAVNDQGQPVYMSADQILKQTLPPTHYGPYMEVYNAYSAGRYGDLVGKYDFSIESGMTDEDVVNDFRAQRKTKLRTSAING